MIEVKIKGIRFKLDLDITVSDDFDVTINSARAIPILKGRKELVHQLSTITESTFKSGCVTIKANSELSDIIKEGDKLQVIFGNKIKKVQMTGKTGRLSGLTEITNSVAFKDEFKVGNYIKICYDKKNHIMELLKP